MTLILSGTDGVSDIDGTAATPAIRGTDANTGIFFPAADTIAFSEGGAEVARFDSSGNFMVGTTSPTTFSGFKTFEYVNSGGNAIQLVTGTGVIAQTISSNSNSLVYMGARSNHGLVFTTNDTERMRIDSSGNVGIGTSALNFASGGGLIVYNNGGQARLILRNDLTGSASTDGFQIIQQGSESGNTNVNFQQAENSAMLFSTNATERMRINSSGAVGIGTNNPLAQLHVVGAVSNIMQILDAGSSRNMYFGNDGNGFYGEWNADTGARSQIRFQSRNSGAGTYSSIQIDGGNQLLKFNTNDTERARITSGGYFKASNSGSYINSTGSYHELRNNAQSEHAVVLENTNTSFDQNGGGAVAIGVTRSQSSSYTFVGIYSGAFTDREFQLRGDGNAYADGTWNNNGADYAEFFESANGQALTLGATVVLDGNKVREATDQDPASAIIGVVRPKEPSKASMVVGNTAWNKWANKYLTDDFDRYIMEDHDVVEWEEQVLEREAVEAVEAVVDEEGNEVSPAVPAQEAVYKTKQHSYESHNIPAGVTVPADAVRKTHDDKGNKFQHYKLNPAWDKDAEYVNRENRPEWNIIGLLGQVKILKGQPVGDRWIKMRDVSATVEEWMIR